MDILSHLGRSNIPSINIDKKELKSLVITGENPQYGRWFLVRSIFKTVILHSWNEDIPFNSIFWKGKDLKYCVKLDGAYKRKWRA